MDLELFAYQKTGSKWLASKKYALLGDEMGLGKSAQAITAAAEVGAERILVVCPASARVNWEREFEKFYPFPFTSQIFSSGKQVPDPLCVLTVCSPSLLHMVKGIHFDLAIIDEAHFFKNLETKRTKMLLGREGIIHRCKRVWLLTGTPAPNHAGELYPFLYVFGQTKLSYWSFVNKFCRVVDDAIGKRIVGTKTDRSLNELKRILKPFLLRRLKRDVLPDLPPILFGTVAVEKDLMAFKTTEEEEQKAQTQEDYIRQAIATGEFAHDPALFANSTPELRKIIGIQKVKGILDVLIPELQRVEYQKIVLFVVHREVIRRLREGFTHAGIGVAEVTGRTPALTRQDEVDRFNFDPECRVFLGNIQAAGTAINLTSADQVGMAEQSYVPGDNAQAIMRVHRIGQTSKKVLVRSFFIADSIDQKVEDIITTKTKELVKLLDQGEFDAKN